MKIGVRNPTPLCQLFSLPDDFPRPDLWIPRQIKINGITWYVLSVAMNASRLVLGYKPCSVNYSHAGLIRWMRHDSELRLAAVYLCNSGFPGVVVAIDVHFPFSDGEPFMPILMIVVELNDE